MSIEDCWLSLHLKIWFCYIHRTSSSFRQITGGWLLHGPQVQSQMFAVFTILAPSPSIGPLTTRHRALDACICPWACLRMSDPYLVVVRVYSACQCPLGTAAASHSCIFVKGSYFCPFEALKVLGYVIRGFFGFCFKLGYGFVCLTGS